MTETGRVNHSSDAGDQTQVKSQAESTKRGKHLKKQSEGLITARTAGFGTNNLRSLATKRSGPSFAG